MTEVPEGATERTAPESREYLDGILAKCFLDEPTAGAVVLVNGIDGFHFVVANMETLEVIATLEFAAKQMMLKFTTAGGTERLQ